MDSIIRRSDTVVGQLRPRAIALRNATFQFDALIILRQLRFLPFPIVVEVMEGIP